MEKQQAESGTRIVSITLLSLSLISFIGIIGFLFTVVPTFSKMFSSFGGQLPFLTQMVVSLSSAITAYWFLSIPFFLGVIGGQISLLFFYKKSWVVFLILMIFNIFLGGFLFVTMYLPIFKLVTIIGD